MTPHPAELAAARALKDALTRRQRAEARLAGAMGPDEVIAAAAELDSAHDAYLTELTKRAAGA
jgi:hypothetical protein